MSTNQQLDELRKRVAELENTVARLTEGGGTSQGRTVIAPFRVSTPEGRVLLEVNGADSDRRESQLKLFDINGNVAASIGVDCNGGWLAIRNREGVLVGYLNIEMCGARLILSDHNDQGGVVLFGGDCNANGGGININSTPKVGNMDIAIWAGPDAKLEITDNVATNE